MHQTSSHTGLDASSLILTKGGLVRTFKPSRPEHTMHLWLEGGPDADSGSAPAATQQGSAQQGQAQQRLIEVQVLKVEGDSVTIRFWAPDPVLMISAGKDPHCRAAG